MNKICFNVIERVKKCQLVILLCRSVIPIADTVRSSATGGS